MDDVADHLDVIEDSVEEVRKCVKEMSQALNALEAEALDDAMGLDSRAAQTQREYWEDQSDG